MIKYFIGSCFMIFLLASCTKENDNFTLESVNDYFPLQVGKYITYDLDSTIFTNFNQEMTTKHYQAQYRVDTAVTDNLGRAAFNISRYLRTDSTQPWTIDNVFTAVPSGKSIELIQDNLRFIKLMEPIKDGASWKGNIYLPYDPYRSYSFADPVFTEDWDYTYEAVDSSLIIGSNNFPNTITVAEIDDTIGDPNVPGTKYAERTYSVEKYAKNVGLIYKEFIHWEYQSIDNTYTGFGEKLSIIDHN
jgi:hypothetical protein